MDKDAEEKDVTGGRRQRRRRSNRHPVGYAVQKCGRLGREKEGKKKMSMEQEREKIYSMAVTIEMEEMADYEEEAIRKDRREHWDSYKKMSHKELIRRINEVADQAEKEWNAKRGAEE